MIKTIQQIVKKIQVLLQFQKLQIPKNFTDITLNNEYFDDHIFSKECDSIKLGLNQSFIFYYIQGESVKQLQESIIIFDIFFLFFAQLLSTFNSLIIQFSLLLTFQYIFMTEIRESLVKGEQLFLQYIEEIEKTKISDISIRRALKKYDVKNLKINNVTPLRAKKMYATIIPKYQNGITTQKSWLQNERRLFIWCTLCYLHKKSLQINDLKFQDFEFLRKMFPLKELDLIKFQIYSLVKRDNKNCGWKPEEDNLLRQLVQKQDGKSLQWSNISKQFFIDSSEHYFRNTKQCRERWLNHLDPNKMKGKWEHEQDIILLTQVLSKGKKWSKIVQALDGKKNEHMIKNRYKSLIHKKQKSCKNKKMKENDLINLILKEYKQGPVANNENGESEEQDQKMQQIDEDAQQLESNIMQNEQQQKQEQVQLKQNNFLVKSQNWPIIVQPNNKRLNFSQKQEMQKAQEQQKQSMMKNEIQLCGSKVDIQFVNNLFFNVNTPVAQQNRIHSILMETRSPAGNLFLSPFPAGCWTPTIFLVDDTQGQTSPQIPVVNFSTTVKSTFHKFLGEDNDKKS